MSILGFDLEYFDPVSQITHQLCLKFFLDDNTIEILKDKSAFLKRIHYPEVQLADLFVGNAITIFNRLYVIKGYANKFTTDFMKSHEGRFLVHLGSDELQTIHNLLRLVAQFGLVCGRIFSYQPRSTLVEVVGTSGKNYDRFIDACRNAGYELQRADGAEVELRIKMNEPALIDGPATLALLKPHVLRSGRAGDVLEYIASQGSFHISALYSFHFTIIMAEEFFEAYRGIVEDYSKFIENICSGPVLAVALTASGRGDFDLVSTFRDFCGPSKPQLAKVLRPDSVRSRFGVSSLENCLHCTDLPEDGDMECRYIFETVTRLR